MGKSLELLRIYYEYKEFLDGLAPSKEDKDKLEQRKQKVMLKIEKRDREAQAELDKKGTANG